MGLGIIVSERIEEKYLGSIINQVLETHGHSVKALLDLDLLVEEGEGPPR